VLQAFGRLHPLLLHLPIGLLVVTMILLFTRSWFEGKSLDDVVSFLLHLTAVTASLTTLMGLLLSLEGTFSADQLGLHKWFGIALSFLCWSLIMVRGNMAVLKPLGLAGAVVLILTGHFGANLTHGEDFVLAPLESEEPRVTRVITDSTALFKATVEPILESKCYGCHNKKKAKGNLIMTSLESIRKGGKNGPLWDPSDAANSLIVERLHLPLDHDDHMPPKDKTQLSDDELNFISMWIDAGADTEKKLKDYTEEDTLMKMASTIIPRYEDLGVDRPQYTFRFASPEKIEKLRGPNRSVFQIAKNEPAIQADFYLRESFDKKYVEELVDVREQLISLNLSRMPVKDTDLSTLSKFPNLEVLNLNNTDIQGDGFKQLASLQKLRSLSVSGTKVTVSALRDIAACKTLKDVYLWNTSIAPDDLAALNKDFPGIRWDTGYKSDVTEVLKLNVPLLKNKSQVLNTDEKIIFKHNLPGTIMRYSVDGTDPDSVNSPVYEEPIAIRNYAVVKTKAYKDGWLSSDVATFIFFRKGFQPDSAALRTKADQKFLGEGVATLIDGNKGLSDFYRHPAWIAFKDNDLVADFSFEKQVPTIRNVTLSFVRNGYTICMPPQEMQVWGGNDPAHLQLIGKVSPPQMDPPGKPVIEGLSMDLPESNYKHYRLVAKPVRKLKGGNPKKRDVWLMVDEVFFN
ncbi:MAG TPA: c-type cytochrome domain-containing protein, partial [Chryseosolibacter sp.]|nr:c-type cytochrome domain-containing protein [Chryseosolibacter sp.]